MIFSVISRLNFTGHFDILCSRPFRMEEVRKSMPSTLTELMAVVEAFAESVDLEEVMRSARST